jgi:hypothetical protein
MVSEVCDDAARVYLEDDCQRMLRSDSSLSEVRDGKPPIVPYMDKVLSSSQRRYTQFIKILHSRGLVRFLTCRREEVAFFFVLKKDGRLRGIVDARRVNERFKVPPSVDLVTAEGLAQVEIPCPDGLSAEDFLAWEKELDVWIGTSDVADCFWRLRIDALLSSYFGLPGLPARSFGIKEIESGPVGRDTVVYPCLAALPMGFSWSVFFAQNAGFTQLVQSSLKPESAMTDRGLAPVFRAGADPRFYLYIDNAGIVGLEKEGVTAPCTMLVRLWIPAGWLLTKLR